MGHYASEMQCDKCGKLRCICPPSVRNETGWIVNTNFSVSTLEDFDREHSSIKTKWGRMPINPLLYRAGEKIYKTRLGAEKGARRRCEETIEQTRRDLTALKHCLKVTRPWEKK